MQEHQPETGFFVYHAQDVMDMVFPHPQKWKDHPEAYTLVAILAEQDEQGQERSLEELFALTNHGGVQDYWPSNPEIVWKILGKVRSTSVGDVIVLRRREGEEKREEASMVMSFGFSIVP